MERLGRSPSMLVFTQEAPDAGNLENPPISDQNPLSDEDDHFYYFNGVLKRVQRRLHI